MIVTSLLALAVGASTHAAVPKAEDPYRPPARVVLAERIDKLCRERALYKPEVANAIILAGSGTMSELCECTTMLTISELSDEQVASVGKDLELVQRIVDAIPTTLSRCVQMKPFR